MRYQVPFLKSLVWLDLGLNPGLPDHWRTHYTNEPVMSFNSFDQVFACIKLFSIKIVCERERISLIKKVNTESKLMVNPDERARKLHSNRNSRLYNEQDNKSIFLCLFKTNYYISRVCVKIRGLFQVQTRFGFFV